MKRFTVLDPIALREEHGDELARGHISMHLNRAKQLGLRVHEKRGGIIKIEERGTFMAPARAREMAQMHGRHDATARLLRAAAGDNPEFQRMLDAEGY